MQSIARWILGVLAVLVAIPAAAGGAGFLDTDQAIKTVKEGQRQYQLLDAWASQRAKEVEAQQDRVTELNQQVIVQRTVESPEAVRRIEGDLLRAQRDLEDAGRAAQRDFEAKQVELLGQVASRVRDLAAEYAQANGFDAIFMFETTPLVYVASRPSSPTP